MAQVARRVTARLPEHLVLLVARADRSLHRAGPQFAAKLLAFPAKLDQKRFEPIAQLVDVFELLIRPENPRPDFLG